MVMRVLILTGGAVEEKFAADYIKQWNPDKVITADKGLPSSVLSVDPSSMIIQIKSFNV